MTTHIALLRGTSVGGQKPIAAETFVELLSELFDLERPPVAVGR